MDTYLPTFLSTLLGAFLATIGGIIGSAFTFYLTKKNNLNDNKKKAYLQLLTFCDEFVLLDKVDKDSFLKEFAEARSLVLLYGSDDVKSEFNEFHKIAVEECNYKEYKTLLRAQIVKISYAMKCDLGIANKVERKRTKKWRKGEPKNAY